MSHIGGFSLPVTWNYTFFIQGNETESLDILEIPWRKWLSWTIRTGSHRLVLFTLCICPLVVLRGIYKLSSFNIPRCYCKVQTNYVATLYYKLYLCFHELCIRTPQNQIESKTSYLWYAILLHNPNFVSILKVFLCYRDLKVLSFTCFDPSSEGDMDVDERCACKKTSNQQ